jgi:hypothetical protein
VRRQRSHDLLALGGDGEVFWEFDVQGDGGLGAGHLGIIPAWGVHLFALFTQFHGAVL